MSALPHRRAAYACRDDGRVPALRHVHRWASDPKNQHGFPKLSMYWCLPGGIASVSERNRPYGNAYGNAMGTSAVCRRAVVEFSGRNGAPLRIKLRTRMLLKLRCNLLCPKMDDLLFSL